MPSFFSKIKNAGTVAGNTAAKDTPTKKKDEPTAELTPLERMLQNAGPLREDGSDKFFGFENFGNTCYCNSIVQALFYNDVFRDHVINYPPHSPVGTPSGTQPPVPFRIRPPGNTDATDQNGKNPQQAMKQKHDAKLSPPGPLNPNGMKLEDKPDTPEYKKRQAMVKGPVLELGYERDGAYGMEECTFTGLKDIFLALIQNQSRLGVLSPQRFLSIFKRDNEMFRNSMHQDAHEFYGLVLNDVIANVEANAQKRAQEEAEDLARAGLTQSIENALGSAAMGYSNGTQSLNTGWVHDIFEGLLTSETECLACGTASQRDETFLDLSIDLAEHTSVTSCLRKFSDDEMLCERNKFHCDTCGGLQEAEKRMKVKRLPKVLTLHLKRFKYTEDYSRLQKLFHRVVYPYHLRMFNTTEDAKDPDRLYELYAVVVHIGGNAYHGHYVSIIKTQDRGWVLFDDELVEPVDKHFVRNFFGDKPGMATAYVLFYQETTFEKVRAEQEKEGMEEVKLANQAAVLDAEDGEKRQKHELASQPSGQPSSQDSTAGLTRQTTQPMRPNPEPDAPGLERASTTPGLSVPLDSGTATNKTPDSTAAAAPASSTLDTDVERQAAKSEAKTKEDKKREKKEREAAEKAEKLAEKERKEQAKQEEKRRQEEHIKNIQARRNEHEELQKVLEESKKSAAKEASARRRESGEPSAFGFLDRSKRGSKSMAKRSFSFFHREKGDQLPIDETSNGEPPESKGKGRLSSTVGRKKSSNVLS